MIIMLIISIICSFSNIKLKILYQSPPKVLGSYNQMRKLWAINCNEAFKLKWFFLHIIECSDRKTKHILNCVYNVLAASQKGIQKNSNIFSKIF
jgi:hypothetical protein